MCADGAPGVRLPGNPVAGDTGSGQPGGVDLHIHTSFSSDGDHTPAEVVTMAQTAGLRAIAIADHDVFGGNHAAAIAASGGNVEIIPCVELTTALKGIELHLLTYFLPFTAPEVTARLGEIRSGDEARARAVVVALRRLGVKCSYDEAAALTPHAVPKCSVIVRAAMTNGSNEEMALFQPYRTGDRSDQPYHNFFLDHMRPGGRAYVAPTKGHFSTIDAIEFAARNGGVPVLAHPVGSAAGTGLIDELVAHGLRGLEVHSPYHDGVDERRLTEYCQARRLIITAGSDFHGATVKPGIEIGKSCRHSYEMVDRLRSLAGD